MTLFYIDPIRDLRVDYERLMADAASIDSVPQVFHSDDGYELFPMLLAAMRDGAPIALTSDEVRGLIAAEGLPPIVGAVREGDGEEDNASETRATVGENASETRATMKNASETRATMGENASEMRGMVGENVSETRATDRCRVGIWTSGTTGIPKLIEHDVRALTRAVRTGDHHRDDVWALAYPPTRFAGLQVFFQAYANRNPIIRLHGLDAADAHRAIDEHGITHISATPTFIRLLCADRTRIHAAVRHVTAGGEPSDPRLLDLIRQTFPNARYRNIYASTEAGSLLVSDGDAFRVPEALRGRVQVIDGQLAVHRDLLADSLRTDSAAVTGDGFYLTGDRVEVVGHEPLTVRFESRRDDMINVGGNKVNPLAVERQLLEIEGVVDVRVYGVDNSVTGKLVACDVVPAAGGAFDLRQFKQAMRSRLSPYQLPRIVNVVAAIASTATGKKRRSP